MPRGYYHESPRPRRSWSCKESGRLLGVLDHVLDPLRSQGLPEKIAVLKEVQGLLEKRRNYTQISAKLNHLFSLYAGRRPKLKPDDIYRLGTKCLPNLPDDLRAEISRTRDELRDRELSRRLEADSYLRSGSKREETQSYCSRPSTEEIQTPIRQHEQLQICKTAQRRARDSWRRDFAVEVSTDTIEVMPRRPVITNNSVSRETSSFSTTSIPESDSSAALDVKPHQLLDANQRSGPQLEQPDSRQAAFYLQKAIEPREFDYDDLELSSQILSCLDPHESRRVLLDLYCDNLFFRKQLSDTELELERQATKARHEKSLQKLIKDNNADSLQNMLDTQLQMNHSLRKQVGSTPFRALQNPNPPSHGLSEIQQDAIGLNKRLKSLASLVKFRYPHQSLDTYASEDLMSLIRVSTQGEQPLSVVEKDIPAESLTLSLIGAAIYDWVYRADCRHLDMMMMNPLHQTYRRNLRELCGAVALHKFDLTARQSMVEEERFQEVNLRRRAECITARLLEAISILIPPHDMSAAKAHLESVFLCAVRIKTRLSLREGKFEPVWPAPRSTFNKYLMTTFLDTEDSLRARHLSNPCNSLVRVALVPGIQVADRSEDMGLCDDPWETNRTETQEGVLRLNFRPVVEIV